jgi:hypothetical protein
MPIISALKEHREDPEFQASLDKVNETFISKPKLKNPTWAGGMSHLA